AHDLKKLQKQLADLDVRYLNKYQNGEVEGTREEWIAVFSTVNALRSMLEEVLHLEKVVSLELPSFSIAEKLKSFFQSISGIGSKIGFSSPAFKFGLRSAIIIGMSMAFYRFFEPEYGFWLVLFTVLLIRPNLGISIQAGRDRLIGTIAGSLLAFVFVLLHPAHGILFYAVLVLVLFLMIWFTNLDKIIPTIIAITFLVICMFSIIFPGDNHLAFLRIGYTAAIVLLVVFLTFLFWPERARLRIANVLVDGLNKEKLYFEAIMNTLFGKETLTSNGGFKKDIEQHFEKGNVLIGAAKSEVLQNKILHHGLQIKLLIQRIYNTLQSLDLAGKKCMENDGFMDMKTDLLDFSSKVQLAFDVLSDAIDKRSKPHGFPDLRLDFERLRSSFRKYKKELTPKSEEINILWRNSTFIWNLKPLILELEGIRDEIEMKMSE
nr:FUSC family protein [Bacteroidota bacterium]